MITSGTWRRISADEICLPGSPLDSIATVHSAGLAQALHLGQALAILPEKISIYAVQAAAIGWEPGLSPEVQRVIPEICADIHAFLQPTSRSGQALEVLN